ncbi:hypothetical protein FBEOM_10784 [Fusarium beomiforme]|uniref:Uncharacterized protein n=1 Tax=Fusarium beomiforme TaxID=44412 RepID=A0A9P5AAQ2_9HYPO|nr:hypothetical protein FBEOM_10784 [Fusarium beomiforme]
MAPATESIESLTANTSDVERLSKHHHNFKSLMRIFDVDRQHNILTFPGIPAWIEKPNDNSNVHHETAEQFDREIGEIPDILEPNDQPEMQEFRFRVLMRGYYSDLKTSITNLQGNSDKIDMPSPAAILQAYDENPGIRSFINNIASLCTKPTFIPALNKHVSLPEGEKICPEAFVFAHAIQILLFAPKTWDPERQYSRDHKYTHQFPYCNTLGLDATDPESDARHHISEKDIRRAILLFYHLIKRRDGSSVWIPISTTDSNLEIADDETDTTDDIAPIKWHDSFDVGTLLLDTFTTRTPTKILPQRLRSLGEPELPPISVKKFRQDLDLLHERHEQPEFMSILSKIQRLVTRVPYNLGISGMNHLVQRLSGGTSNSNIDWLSPIVTVEECVDWESPGCPEINNLGYEESSEHDSQAAWTLFEHRKNVLVSFDWRNKMVFDLEEPPFLATIDTAKRVIKQLQDPEIEQSLINGRGETEVDAIIEKYNMILRDPTGGLSLLDAQVIIDESKRMPSNRNDCIHWACYYSPIMTRAIELAWKYCRDDKEQVVVYVEDPWIQCIVVALFVTAGFSVGTIRSSDNDDKQANIVAQWKNKASSLEILVANMDPKVLEFNL